MIRSENDIVAVIGFLIQNLLIAVFIAAREFFL